MQLAVYGTAVASPAGPVVSIAGGSAVTEGGSASFTVTATPAPASSITVNLTIGQTGSFVAAGDLGSKTVTVGTSGSATYSVPTADDSNEETSGSVTATVVTGTGYRVHATDDEASVTVNDNDGAPSFSSAAVNGTALTVTFDESLDTSSLPAGSAFTVSGGRTGTGTVSVSGAVASVTLDRAVTAGETVTVSYTTPTANPLQDAAGNDVADFSGKAVTNNSPDLTLVANTGQSQDTFGAFQTTQDMAQKFTTGGKPGGYKLARVDLRLQNGGAGQPDYAVTVRTDSSDAPNATALGTLTTTATWPDSYGLVSFSASGDGISLAANTDYWLVIDVSNGRNSRARMTRSSSEDSGAAAGWSIGNATRRVSDAGTWIHFNRPMQIALYGTGAATGPPAFSSAAVNGTALTVTFDENLDTSSLPAGSAFTVSGGRTGTGTVSVSGAVASVTLDRAVTAGETVTVSYTTPTANPLQDAAGNDVADFSGKDVTNNTPVPKLVANTGQSQDNLINLATSRDVAQKFTTGGNSGGYKLTRVEVRLQNGGAGQPDYAVEVRTDSSGTPNAATEGKLGTLANADWPDAFGLVTFSAGDDGISLAANTDYWLVIDATNGRSGQVRRTDSTSEDTGAATGWSIDNNFLRRADDDSSWTSSTKPIQLAVYGSVGGGVATPVVSIAGGSAVTEGGSATFTVTASPAPASSITVDLTIGQTGSFAAAGDLGPKTVTVGTSGSATYTVATVDDPYDEASGSVTATVGMGMSYLVHATDDEASVIVNDNDDPPPPVVSVVSGSSLAEAEGVVATFVVTSSPPPRWRT